MKFWLVLLAVVLSVSISARLYGQDDFKEWKETDTAISEKKDSTYTNKPSELIETPASLSKEMAKESGSPGNHFWLAITIAATIVAGILVRFKVRRFTRTFFLVGSLAFFGFYRGSCPCPVGGFQEAVLAAFGVGTNISWLWWFIILVPLTYLFGRVWCGWVCQLGALQELLHQPGKFNLLSSARSQRILRYVRLSALIILVLQLLLTKSIVWKSIDPFRSAFNLMAPSYISLILLVVLLVSSILMYRPFCKTLCPVGFILGWIAEIPGAASISIKKECIGCKACSKSCKTHAITYTNKVVTFDKRECIACGDCMTDCPIQGIRMRYNDDANSTKIIYPGKAV
jgi:ferredoxin